MDFKDLANFGYFWPFFATSPKKFEFWLPDNYAWKDCQSNHCVQTAPLGHFLCLPRDQCQRNSPKKMKRESCQNINSMSGRPFYIKITPKGFSGHAEFPGDINDRRKNEFRIWHFWPNCLYLSLKKIPFLDFLQLWIEMFSIVSVGLKTSSGTNFGAPKGPGTKK